MPRKAQRVQTERPPLGNLKINLIINKYKKRLKPTLNSKEKNNFDQFYTNPLTAKKLTSIFLEKLKELGYQKINFLEPAAGTEIF